MDAPTTADVQGWTELDTLKSASSARADRLVAIAISTLKRITGIDFAQVKADDVPIVQHAVTGLAEMLTFQTDPDYLESLSDFDLLASFSAGPYSETRRDPKAAREARLLVAWPWLSDLLWTIMSPDRWDFWMAYFSGQNAPAFDVQEVDWSGHARLYGTYDDSYLWGA